MFLHNHKLAVVSYSYTEKEIVKYLQSIENFLINIINTNSEFELLDIRRDFQLDSQDYSAYEQNENKKEVLEKCFALLQINLIELINKEVDKKVVEYLNKEPAFLLLYYKKIFYKDASKTKIVEKINKNTTKKLKHFSDIIIPFFTKFLTEDTVKVLEVFLENKMPLHKIIEEDTKKYIDMFPLPNSYLGKNIKIQNKNTLDFSKIKNLYNYYELPETNDIGIHDIVYGEEDSESITIGVSIGDFLFFYDIYALLRDNILDGNHVKLEYLKYSILLEDDKDRGTSEKIEEFRREIMNENLLKILSNLVNNLYTKEHHFSMLDSTIQKKFFNKGYKVESKYLEQNQIYIPYIEDAEALFGIHNNTDARPHDGTSLKGLKTWIDTSNHELNTATTKLSTKAEEVIHLLPDIAFYFKEKFFEDLLEIILHEIKEEYSELELEINTNKIFYIDKEKEFANPLDSKAVHASNCQEFDFIVNFRQEDGTKVTVVIEAKTKLSKFIIQDQAEKVEKYMKYDDLNIFDKYFLVGFNSDKTVDSAMAYFIKNMPIDNTKDLGFEYPLPSTDSVLYCTASNNREQLKQNLLALFNPELQKKIHLLD